MRCEPFPLHSGSDRSTPSTRNMHWWTRAGDRVIDTIYLFFTCQLTDLAAVCANSPEGLKQFRVSLVEGEPETGVMRLRVRLGSLLVTNSWDLDWTVVLPLLSPKKFLHPLMPLSYPRSASPGWWLATGAT